MKLGSIALLSLAFITGCAGGEGPKWFNGAYYYVGDPSCRRVAYDTASGKVNCYRANGELSDSRSPMTDTQMQAYNSYAEQEQIKQQQNMAQLQQTLNQANQTAQQTFNMAMGMVNQTQIGNLNTTQFTPIQKTDGTWVYCIRTSSYTVNCRTN